MVRAVADGQADAGAVGDAGWAALRSEGYAPAVKLEVAWRSPTYFHCNLHGATVTRRRWRAAVEPGSLDMSYNDPTLRRLMDLEGVKLWIPAERSGYADLADATREQGLLR